MIRTPDTARVLVHRDEPAGNREWNRQYDAEGHAAFYARKRDTTLTQRISNQLERDMVRRGLRRLADRYPIGSILDLPTGTGRMASVGSEFARIVIAMDASHAMLTQFRPGDLFKNQTVLRCVGSAFAIPLADAAVDVVVCVRLIHHLPDADSRIACLSELARVAKAGVVLTFFDAVSLYGWRRRARTKRKPKKNTRHTLTRRQLGAESAAGGLKLIGANALLRFHSEITSATFVIASNGC